MVIDITAFGHGMGLVMIGWAAGTVIGVMITVFKRTSEAL